jgi:hypothetical protein
MDSVLKFMTIKVDPRIGLRLRPLLCRGEMPAAPAVEDAPRSEAAVSNPAGPEASGGEKRGQL